MANYDPSDYDDEIYLITKRSRGYAGGFEDEREPILGDDVYTPMIKDRILHVLRVFVEKGVVCETELTRLSSDKGKKRAGDEIDLTLLSLAIDDFKSKIRWKDSEIINLKSENWKKKEHAEFVFSEFKILEDEYYEIFKQANVDKLVNYMLTFFIKYCDAHIGGSNVGDYKVFLLSLDACSSYILNILYQDLTVEEWCNLMEKMQGVEKVQYELDQLTLFKKD